MVFILTGDPWIEVDPYQLDAVWKMIDKSNLVITLQDESNEKHRVINLKTKTFEIVD